MTEVLFAQFGTQADTLERANSAVEELLSLFETDFRPTVLDRGQYIDADGFANATLMAYWFAPQDYEKWAAQEEVESFWASRSTTGPVGYYRETAIIPRDHIETLYTPHDPRKCDTAGIAQHVEVGPTKVHDYWGSARDRITASRTDELEGELFEYVPTTQETLGKHVTVAVPGNVCLIRTAQDWRNSTVFKDDYFANVDPIKDSGVDYLATHPETGCLQTRKVREQSPQGELIDRACTLGWFLSLEHLMTWSRGHRSHLEIYGAFFRMMQGKDGIPMDMSLWHEVSVIPKGSATAEYINCHNRTGFLTILDHTAAQVAL
ncbi:MULTISPECIES: phenylacetaldoxime dehydratase family protein [unclassified Rhodococcus (in: high G+C Gram-positive bacteria)]|uniref:phenylacetaldoxime dehydratase family protein n=1 Tax=unclassified Rhodococcus (in: high G+C Gram-positive bacteria) TaxID=192944 RepID=UPI001482CCC1|nr:phenylacetaldoxime dehydratase family protein [Rhodococcus sp. M8]QPG44477.1 phenylacetaldoxime dehydratase family protein [Rhodococcus sp. M8]